MEARVNDLGQPIGAALPDWQGVPRPPREAMVGHYCRVEPVDVARHAGELYQAFSEDMDGRIWTYLAYGPFDNEGEFTAWLADYCLKDDPLFHTIIDEASGQAVGMASYCRIDPGPGVIEVGHINYSPRLQRTIAATETMYLMMRRVFTELGYRRYEWKCDALNAPSRRAAERLGFRYEGLFRQAIIYKQRNRDTTWFSIIDAEWPALDAAYQEWLDPANFDAAGQQKASLAEVIGRHRG